jgi:polysaccharide export outer membrane protein
MALQFGGKKNFPPKGWNSGLRKALLVANAAVLLLLGSVQPALAHEQVISTGARYQPAGLQAETYPLGSGDKVHVNVFNELQLTGDFIVDSAGNLSLPLIGATPVKGKTVSEAAREVEAAYLKGDFLRTPRVSIEVTTYRPFFILGEVRSPGQYPYVAGLTALNAIATSQGLTPRAKKKIVYIRRFGETSEEAYALTPDLRVWPGDTIRVAERLF